MRGTFGWSTVDDVSLPYLLRDDKQYVAVRMVELKLLSRYPSVYPEELRQRPALISHYVTVHEAALLNEINTHHCNSEYGLHPFKPNDDLIVRLEDFEEFYTVVKKHFPNTVTGQTANNSNATSQAPSKPSNSAATTKDKITVASCEGGWVLVNSTVVPYLRKNKAVFVPLSVIRYAAGLLNDVIVEKVVPSEEECTFLNQSCQKAGLNFTFAKTTRLVTLSDVQSKSDENVGLHELPIADPFGSAERMLAGITGAQPGLPPHVPMQAMPPAMPPHIPGRAPAPLWMNPHLGMFPGAGLPPGMPCISVVGCFTQKNATDSLRIN